MFGQEFPKQQEMSLSRLFLPRPIRPAGQRRPPGKIETAQGLDLGPAAT
jgi:hypothetical protein